MGELSFVGNHVSSRSQFGDPPADIQMRYLALLLARVTTKMSRQKGSKKKSSRRAQRIGNGLVRCRESLSGEVGEGKGS
jgi:hypothetical protein